MTPVSEKIQGPLGEYFEVVNKDYKANGDGKISVEIKRIKAGFPEPWEEGMEVGYDDRTFSPLFSLEFQDGDGNVVGKDASDIVFDKEELKSIAALGVDESASLTFDCPEDAKQFKVSSTFEATIKSFTANLAGSVGPYAIQMTMNVDANGHVTGAYYYKKNGPGALLYIKGQKNGDAITLTEFNKKGVQTGSFSGTYSDGVYTGHFTANSGEYTFTLSEDDAMETLDLSAINFDSFITYNDESTDEDSYETETSDDSYESSGTEDWDDLLRTYEQYVDKYISLAKKAAKGDYSALSEYPAFLEKAQELSDQLKNAKDNMTASQLAKLNKITIKMAKAAQELR